MIALDACGDPADPQKRAWCGYQTDSSHPARSDETPSTMSKSPLSICTRRSVSFRTVRNTSRLNQRGALWAVGRLAEAFPFLLLPLKAGAFLLPFLESRDPAVRGNAIMALGLLGDDHSLPGLNGLLRDREVVHLYRKGKFVSGQIEDFAQEAIERIKRAREQR